MLDEYLEETIDKYFDDVNVEGLKSDLLQHLLIEIKIEPELFEIKGVKKA